MYDISCIASTILYDFICFYMHNMHYIYITYSGLLYIIYILVILHTCAYYLLCIDIIIHV